MGVGRKLMLAVDEAAIHRGLVCLIAWLSPDNVRSMGVVRTMGYQIVRTEVVEEMLPGLTANVPGDMVFIQKKLL